MQGSKVSAVTFLTSFDQAAGPESLAMKVLYYGAFSSFTNAAMQTWGFLPSNSLAAVQNPARLYNWGRIQRKTWCMEPYAGVDYNLSLCPLQSRLQHIHHGQPYARVDFIPQSGTFDLASVPAPDSE